MFCLNSSLKFRVSIFGWDLILIRDLFYTMESYTLCSGVLKLSCVAKTVEDPSGPQTSGKNMIVRHTIPVVKDANENFAGSDSGVQPMPFKVCTFFRTEKCEMLCQPSLQICCSCLTANEKCLRELEKKNSTSSTPLPKKAPLSVSPVPRLVATINQHWLECKQLEQRMKQISTNGMKLSEGLENDITSVISKHSLECSPHMKLFWEQQKKTFCLQS